MRTFDAQDSNTDVHFAMNDYEFQKDYVLAQLPRLLAMQDQNPLSPSHGCFHYGYWRDKVSEFSDARFQEAGATLLLATHPAFEKALGNIEPERLQIGAEAAIGYWRRSQHRDGSFDEWYKHEHGFAATCFSLIAYSLANEAAGSILSEQAQLDYRETAERCGTWLLEHDDLIKTNHEMCAAGALAVAARVLGNSEFEQGAKSKFEKSLACQNEEGWFNEISGMDLGYCSVLLDYAMLYHRYTGDDRVVPAMRRLFSFLSRFIHPNGTVSAEAGLCLNPYVSRLGLNLLASHDSSASYFADRFESTSPGHDGISPYLADDLRLTRWSHLPLMTCLLRSDPDLSTKRRERLAGFKPEIGAFHAPKANIVACRTETYHGVFLPAGGGIIRIHASEGSDYFEDLGYEISSKETKLGTAGYDATRTLDVLGSYEFRCELSFFPSAFFFPGLISRTILRVLGEIPGAHVWLRRGIDFYRQNRKTAVNQSAAPIAKGKAIVRCERRVDFDDTGATVTDVVTTSDPAIDLRTLIPIGSRNGRQRELLKSWNEALSAIEATAHAPLKAIRVVKRTHGPGLATEITVGVLE